MKIFNILVLISICIISSVKADSKHNIISELKKGGKLIFHLPFLHVVDKDNYIEHLNENFEAFSYK